MTQLALNLERPKGKSPRVTQAHVDELIQALYLQGWRTAAQLGFHTETDKRILRAIASASGGHVISGQGGYRLNFEATADENKVATGWLRHQIADMTRRVLEIERVYHSKQIPACLRARVKAARHAA